MPGRMPVWRIVAAADVPADLTQPEMDPAAADLQAIFAAFRTGRYLLDLEQVPASFHNNKTVRFLLCNDITILLRATQIGITLPARLPKAIDFLSDVL